MSDYTASMGRSVACIEAVEPRLLMSGDVSVSIHNGTLEIIGDRYANEIRIEQPDKSTGGFVVSSADGATTINGQLEALTFADITSVQVRLRKGNDKLYAEDIHPSKSLRVDMGAGDDSFVESGGKLFASPTIPFGPNTFEQDPVPLLLQSGSFVLDSGSGNDTVDIGGLDSWRKIRIRTGNGNDEVTLEHLPTFTTFRMDLGNGNDRFNVQQVYSLGLPPGGPTPTRSIRGGAGRDVFIGQGEESLPVVLPILSSFREVVGSKRLEFTRLRSGYSSDADSAFGTVVHNVNELVALELFQPVVGHGRVDPLYSVNYALRMVIGVFAGERPTGGYSIRITDVTETATEIIVHTAQVSPGPNEEVTQSLTYPCDFVTIPRSAKPVVFADLP